MKEILDNESLTWQDKWDLVVGRESRMESTLQELAEEILELGAWVNTVGIVYTSTEIPTPKISKELCDKIERMNKLAHSAYATQNALRELGGLKATVRERFYAEYRTFPENPA